MLRKTCLWSSTIGWGDLLPPWPRGNVCSLLPDSAPASGILLWEFWMRFSPLVVWRFVTIFTLSPSILKDMFSQDSPFCSVNPHFNFLKTWVDFDLPELICRSSERHIFLAWGFCQYVRDTVYIWNLSLIALMLHHLLGPIGTIAPSASSVHSRPSNKRVYHVSGTVYKTCEDYMK